MAKILIEDQEENTRVPFLRGILIRSLQDAGLLFTDAYDLATDVRNALDDSELLTTHELRRKVLDLLQARFGPEVSSRYEKQKKDIAILVEQRDGQLTPFYRLEFQNTLETIGVTMFMTLPGPMSGLDAWNAMLATSRRIAELLHTDLLDDGKSTFTRRREGQIREELREYDRAQKPES